MISQTRYVRIVSGVGAGAGVADRELMLRLISTSSLIPPGVVMEFTSADGVMVYFGASSEEYARAVRYFGFVSKTINSPRTLSISRWVSDPIAAEVVGDALPKTLAPFKTFSAATVRLVYDGTQLDVSGIDLTAATSLTDVAAKIQAALQAAATDASVSPLETAVVTYNTNTNQFSMAAGSAAAGSGSLTVVSTTNPADISNLLGWTTTGTVFVKGQSADEPVEAVSKAAKVSNNFGSFLFTGDQLTLAQATAVAQWNDAQNNLYMYTLSTTADQMAAWSDALIGYSGTALNLRSSSLANDYIDQAPAEIAAATNYNQPNAVQNYMYYVFADRNVTISDDDDADTADALRFNYIGVTQQAGQQLAFYQRGVLCGGSSDALDMNVYVNEMWLKSSFTSRLLEMFINLPRVSADSDGASTVLAILQTVIDNAKINGVISYGKSLSEVQKQYIGQISGESTAWRQVESIGYWITVGFETETTKDGRIEYYATYTLVYSKDDAIRRVDGRDVMI